MAVRCAEDVNISDFEINILKKYFEKNGDDLLRIFKGRNNEYRCTIFDGISVWGYCVTIDVNESGTFIIKSDLSDSLHPINN